MLSKRIKDMRGRKCGRLTVITFAGFYIHPRHQSHAATWKCVCSCGTEVIVGGNALRSGHTQSCGCQRIFENKRGLKKCPKRVE